MKSFAVEARGVEFRWTSTPHNQFGLYRFPIDQPDKMEIVHATTYVEVPTGAIGTFELINPPDGYRYECRWRWIEENM